MWPALSDAGVSGGTTSGVSLKWVVGQGCLGVCIARPTRESIPGRIVTYENAARCVPRRR